MSETRKLRRENAALRERISALYDASLRIGSSLDLDTVLDGIAESARALTGARYAAIATMDEDGNPVDFVTSGFTEEEHRAIAAGSASSVARQTKRWRADTTPPHHQTKQESRAAHTEVRLCRLNCHHRTRRAQGKRASRQDRLHDWLDYADRGQLEVLRPIDCAE